MQRLLPYLMRLLITTMIESNKRPYVTISCNRGLSDGNFTEYFTMLRLSIYKKQPRIGKIYWKYTENMQHTTFLWHIFSERIISNKPANGYYLYINRR